MQLGRCGARRSAVALLRSSTRDQRRAAHDLAGDAGERLIARLRARGAVMTELPLDAAGRRRSPATMPGFHAGRPPHNKGVRYPADPPSVEEIVAVMRSAGDGPHGRRLRALIVALWRAGLRINEALALSESDLDRRRGSLLVRRGKGGRRSEVGMDEWGWEHLQPWLDLRLELPVGALFCVINGPTRAPVVSCGGARSSAPSGHGRRRAATLRAPSAAPRPR